MTSIDNRKSFISVIIPLYNTENYIADTIKSLGEQTYRDFEVIFVNDGSTDNSLSVAKIKAEEYNLDYTIVEQENQGQGQARNAGVKNSSGKWIYFLDSDDVIQPFTFSLFSKAASLYDNAQIFFSDFEKVNDENVFTIQKENYDFTVFSAEKLSKRFLLRKIIILDPGTFYLKSFLTENQITHKSIRWSEDQMFIWEVLGKCKYAVKMNSITYNYRVRQNSIMTATQIDRIKSAYDYFNIFSEKSEKKFMRKYLLARWTMGSLHSFAKYGNYSDFYELADYMKYKRKLRKLLLFPNFKVKLTALIGIISPKKVFYKLLKN